MDESKDKKYSKRKNNSCIDKILGARIIYLERLGRIEKSVGWKSPNYLRVVWIFFMLLKRAMVLTVHTRAGAVVARLKFYNRRQSVRWRRWQQIS